MTQATPVAEFDHYLGMVAASECDPLTSRREHALVSTTRLVLPSPAVFSRFQHCRRSVGLLGRSVYVRLSSLSGDVVKLNPITGK